MVGVFSVSSTKKVQFSCGNLQYIASSGTWQFASEQTEIIGNDNTNISNSYSGPIDLFGWGTGISPTNTSTDNLAYSTFVDWGINDIYGDIYGSNSWETLTHNEWTYLFNNRDGNMFVKVIIAGSRRGIIIFPDAYTPSSSLSLSSINGLENDYVNIPASTWATLEENGCVFLPTKGSRNDTDMAGSTSTQGYY